MAIGYAQRGVGVTSYGAGKALYSFRREVRSNGGRGSHVRVNPVFYANVVFAVVYPCPQQVNVNARPVDIARVITKKTPKLPLKLRHITFRHKIDSNSRNNSILYIHLKRPL
jgi:hypothetical protein